MRSVLRFMLVPLVDPVPVSRKARIRAKTYHGPPAAAATGRADATTQKTNPSLTGPDYFQRVLKGLGTAPVESIMVRIDFNRLRFLVIDDNAHMRRILRTLLHGFGTREVYEAEDGAAGLEAFTHYMPDIVLTDWAMPIFDGLELTQMIRQPGANANPYVPIIMLTGHSEKKRVIASRDAGVTEFLAKPISAKALYQRILNVVANPRPFIRTKTYFGPDRRRNVNPNYVGPERRKGGKADVIRQQPLLAKAQAPV
jgi:two-component system, chemotaxis family, chemotaxis protein CheY